MLEFDAETTRLLDSVYEGADVTRRRRGSFDALSPAPGEIIADIGCGNGLLTAELARAVGPMGRILGIDPSDAMRQSAENRCREYDWVEITDGWAGQLPVEDASLDKAVSVQVFEYLDDIPAAVAEAYRSLKQGGRLVVGDIHFGSLVWFSQYPKRMARMVKAWDQHFVDREVPAHLPAIFRDAGLILESVTPVTICDTQLRPDGLANMMIILMKRFAEANGLVPELEAKEWAEEQRSLAKQGKFFFSVTHFVVSGRKV
ncbi:methyltransferase domain-containing protein [Ruegeria arenilitoris]|uniref:methyltransferase domain-containing protein n=1 Tax=Ruegeria arenilitoris TaxID=1173585 RepID=UPI0014818F80|nr:methyltransferase domain-containing protein [Ruegeria arenilitoris]